jgi:hypothetical protein
MLIDEIREVENQLLDSAVRSSRDTLDRLVSDEFVELGSSGLTYWKADVIAQMLAQPTVKVEVSHFEVRELATGVALATYRTPRSLRSSIWRHEGGNWRIVFHQGTNTPAPT